MSLAGGVQYGCLQFTAPTMTEGVELPRDAKLNVSLNGKQYAIMSNQPVTQLEKGKVVRCVETEQMAASQPSPIWLIVAARGWPSLGAAPGFI